MKNLTSDILNFAKRNRIIILIMLTSFILRILFSADNNKSLFYDIESYKDFALYILNTGSFPESTYHPPIYPFFIAIIYKIFDCKYIYVYIVQSIIGTLNTLLIYLIAKNIFNKKTGEISAAISLLYWPLTLYSGILMSEVLFLFLFLYGIYFFLKGIDEHKIIWFVLCGIFLSLSALTRSINLLFLIFIPIMYFYFYGENVKTVLRNILVFISVFILVLAPWVIRNYILFHAFIPVDSLGGINLYIGNNENANGFFMDITGLNVFNSNYYEHEIDRVLKKSAYNFILSRPVQFVMLTIRRGALFIVFDFIEVDWVIQKYMEQNILFHNYIWYKMSYVLIYISDIFFFFMGVFGITNLLQNKKSTILLFVILYHFALISLFYIQARYRLSIMPFISIAGAITVNRVYRALKEMDFPVFAKNSKSIE